MISYRAANSDDAPVLDHIFDTSFCDTFGHLYAPEDLQSFLGSFGIDDWREHIADPAFSIRIAEVNGEPVGYIKIGPLKLPIEAEGPGLLLDQLYVLKELHGSGIAQSLMDWGFDESRRRGAAQLFLTVFIDNHRARRFYDRYGFEAVGRYDFMVGNHADEDIIRRKKL